MRIGSFLYVWIKSDSLLSKVTKKPANIFQDFLVIHIQKWLILEPHAIDTIIDAFKLDDLKAMCRKLLGVSPGVKRALGARLLNWLNDCKKKSTSNIVQAKHSVCVKKVILAGKPVPHDVRDEYPQFKDLQPKDSQIRFSLEF